MKKIDYYIIKKFLGTFFFAISLIIIIVIIFDVSEKVDDFIEKKAPLTEIIFVYYLNFIPYFVNLFSPLFTFIAVIFFTSKMAYNSEIVAILSSGVSFKRLLRPYFLASLFLAIMSFILANFIIPPANATRLEFEKRYLKNFRQFTDRNAHIQISEGTYIYMESFDNAKKIGYRFTLEKINSNGLSYKLTADQINWDSLKTSWHIINYTKRTFFGLKESYVTGKQIDTTLNLKPSDFSKQLDNLETMNYMQIREFIKEEELKGSDNIPFYEVEKHKRIAFPFATVVLTLIGVSLSSRKLRGGIGMHLGVGITISFTFILFMQISTTFSTYSNLPSFIGVWIPNVIFTVLGLYLLKVAPK